MILFLIEFVGFVIADMGSVTEEVGICPMDQIPLKFELDLDKMMWEIFVLHCST
jgi:hypothetical protein